jgi:ribosomal-protein-alanine N-acetyltransferase
MRKDSAVKEVKAKVTFRSMRWWDVQSAYSLEIELFPDAWSTEQFLSELAHVPQTRWYVVAEDDQGLLGYVGLRAVAPDGDVQTIAVAPRAQGQGVGRDLLDALLAEASERHCSQVFLEVRADNATAIGLYQSRGFESTGLRRGYYGPGQDAVIMRRRRPKVPTE